MGSLPQYRHAGAVLVRATTDPGGLELPEHLDLDADHSVLRAGRRWLEQLWQRGEVQAALRVASPALSQQIEVVVGGGRPQARELRRVIVSTWSYLLRWQRRPTPFGLFAGIAAAAVGEKPRVSFGHDHRIVARADARWLSELVERLERDTRVLPRLTVVVNSAGFVRADRFVVPVRPDDIGVDRGTSREISVRLTKPVRAALAAAAQPIRFGELAQSLHGGASGASADAVDTLLAGLVERDVLLTSLRAPMTTVDGLAHLVEKLQELGGTELPEVAVLLEELLSIHDELDQVREPAHLEAVAERMRTAAATDQAAGSVLAVDVALDCRLTVPEAVLREAESAAAALLRLTPHPFGAPMWKDFHLRFRERYGAGAVVAVRDVVADSGLGYPAGFLDAARREAARALTERDASLLALIQQAAVDGRTEIELTERLIGELTVGDPAEMIPPPRVELAFQLHAACVDALPRHEFELWITGAPRPASSMAGRFAHLLTEADQRRLADHYNGDGEALAAQLSFPPRRPHNENITRAPRLLPRVISVSEHHSSQPYLIALDDLAVTADATQLYLVQLSTGRRIHPRVLHALEGSVQTPPLVRFLAELPSARCGVYGPFDFGAARTLPFLPRVHHGRAVLSTARWLLDAPDLPTRRCSMPEWAAALDAWRKRWRVPASVVLCQGELRLPLDLDDRRHRILLRHRLDHASRVEIRETGDQSDLAWAGRPCELLVPLTLTHPRPAQAPTRAARPVTVGRGDALMPGRSGIVYARLTGHPRRFDEILTDHLPDLHNQVAQDTASSWFRRHHDTARPDADHHLDLYLRLHARECYGTVAALLAAWATKLAEHGLAGQLDLCTHQPQHGRYGHSTTETVEDVFAADSAAALAEIRMATRAGIPRAAITATSLTDVAACLAPSPPHGWQWLVDQLPQDKGKLDRSWRAATMWLMDAGSDHASLRTLPGGDSVAAAWDRRRSALVAYRIQLEHERDPATVLRSLLHDHHVRALDVDTELEWVVNRLARVAALRRLALHGRRHP